MSLDVVSGLKVEFVLANALMGTSILSLTLSKHVAAYYVTSFIYGFQRSALFTVPFIVAKNYIQEQVSELYNYFTSKALDLRASSISNAVLAGSCIVSHMLLYCCSRFSSFLSFLLPFFLSFILSFFLSFFLSFLCLQARSLCLLYL